MMRSYLLALKLKVTSITDWCRMLRETPLYALLSGFPFGDTPGVGTFYDFFSRIWNDATNNLSPKDRFPKRKTPKGKKKGDKTPCDSSSMASNLLPLLERWQFKPDNPFSLIFRLYKQQFLDLSVRKGLVHPEHLALAGDGTPVRCAAQQRKKRICKCKEFGSSSCSCKRHYSQPDCNWGWDSHRECYFFGYHLYMYVASDSHSDLPIFPLLERASRHDMLSFLHSFFTMKAYLPEFSIEKLLLDSAHDAYAVYQYCRRENITPFIDLNPGHTGHFTYKDAFPLITTVSRSVSWAYVCIKMDMRLQNTVRNTRCPKSNRKPWLLLWASLFTRRNMAELCTSLPMIIQGYLTYRQGIVKHGKEYDGRTSVERSNKREKEDYKLEDGRHRSTKMWYCRLYGIMMLQHLDAWNAICPGISRFLIRIPRLIRIS